MRGADQLIAASAASGIEICFANAGTTEMTLVDAMTQSHAIRAIPTLFEGVASGAADGYARMAGKPASVLLHLGPGLGNATANLHNARRGQAPVVNWVGDHTTWLLPHDPPLTSDIDGIASGTSRWIARTTGVEDIGALATRAVSESYGPTPGVSTLILHADHLEAPCVASNTPPIPTVGPRYRAPDGRRLDAAIEALRGAAHPLLLLGGLATDPPALRLASRLAAAVGCSLMLESWPRRVRREPGLPAVGRLAYFPFQARTQLAKHDAILLIGADSPSCFFGYEGQAPSLLPDSCWCDDPTEGGLVNPHAVLEGLVSVANAPTEPASRTPSPDLRLPRGRLNPDTTARVLAERLPDEAIVLSEGITSSPPLYPQLAHAAPHDILTCKGGAIGWAIPAAIGAALACPERPVVAQVGDGASLYTIQGLWTQACEGLNITTLVMVNQKYNVLQFELMRLRAPVEGANAALTELSGAPINFAQLAMGFGVPAFEARDVDTLRRALDAAFATPGPSLVAVHIS